MLAALGMGNANAVACAIGHLLFNIYGTVIFWPLQFIPISLAKGFARIAARRRLVAVGFLVGLFFVLPAVAILIVKLTRHLMAG
jgi:sodium-dependent phosphate cotransporter